MDTDIVLELSPEEIAALQAPYLDSKTEEQAPVKAKAEAPAKVDREPEKVTRPDDDPEVLRKRIQAADERAAQERQRRLEAERRAHESGQSAAIANATKVESQYTSVANALAKANGDLESAKAAHLAALEAGDYRAATDAADRMADLRAKAVQLDDGKAQLEARVKEAREQAKAAVETKPALDDADPFERYVGQFGPREQAWLRSHPECVNDEEVNAKVLWADKAAKKAGIKPGTDEYFTHLDKAMGYAKDDPVDDDIVADKKRDEPKVEAKATKPPPAKRVAAPVSRDGVIQRTADGRVQLVLTPQQAEIADSMGMSRTAYAKQLAKLQQSQSDPNYSGPRLGVY